MRGIRARLKIRGWERVSGMPQSKEGSAHLSRKAKGKSESFEVGITAVIFQAIPTIRSFPSHIGLNKELSRVELSRNTFMQNSP